MSCLGFFGTLNPAARLRRYWRPQLGPLDHHRLIDGGDVGTDESRGLLVDTAFAAIGVVLSKRERAAVEGYRVHLVIAVVIEDTCTNESSASLRTM